MGIVPACTGANAPGGKEWSGTVLGSVAAGRLSTNRLPRPGSLVTSIVPPKTAAIRWTTARLKPTPACPRRSASAERSMKWILSGVHPGLTFIP
jgi:hypothetical protein